MRYPLLVAAAAILAVPPGLHAAIAEQTSWGKVGVSMEQYRRDAGECGRAGYYLDVSQTEAAKVFKRASSELEGNEAGAHVSPLDTLITSAQIVQGTRPDMRMNEVGTLLQGTVDECLKARGYTHFRLTRDQRRKLEKLHLGSPQRHLYLFQLATDPKILSAQAL